MQPDSLNVFPRITRKAVLPLLLLMNAVLFTGCARFQYQILQPAEVAQTIPKGGVRVHVEPLEYRFEPLGERLGIAIINPTDRPIQLLADRSYLVNPRQATFPFRGGIIAPRSFIEASIPPAPMIYRAQAPSRFGISFGFGSHFYGGHPYGRFHYPFYDPFYDPMFYNPPDYRVSTPLDWEWRTGEVQLHLVYEVPADRSTFEHHFTIIRQRVK